MASTDEKGMIFRILQHPVQPIGARLGLLRLPNRPPLLTPHYVAITSRGAVPHLTQDTFVRDTSIPAVYAALEDFLERPPPSPFLTHPSPRHKLRHFISLPSSTLLVIGPRRTPPIPAPAANPNTDSTISVCTSVGFRILPVEDYIHNVEVLGADVVVAVGDIPFGRALGNKRIERAGERSGEWLGAHVAERTSTQGPGAEGGGVLFAPLLPVHCERQRFYLEECVIPATTMMTAEENESGGGRVQGLALYHPDTLTDLPSPLHALPRIGFTDPANPYETLQQILRGFDMLTLPFVSSATDAGVSLDFTFPAPARTPNDDNVSLPLGHDLWIADPTSLLPLTLNCTCYTCRTHHCAYITHLLHAKEMLGWTLLQIHNHAVMERFFAGVRTILRDGKDGLEDAVRDFDQAYERTLPEGSGKGPRVRGYQFKSEGPGEKRRNEAPFQELGGGMSTGEGAL